ncbi:MAG: UTP--glucose-1-phosphate uridylyltransferase [Rickettsiales bacterium]|jgi:UTP--glucose-1-phosphate uridylyltransferase|nr:UTP--glucose-1-phosphate uridylyltransferase [Rickettsiales bacterium]
MYSKRIRTLVLPVGGLGTRFLPATKAIPKEMLPVAEKPLVQYAFEEGVEAGIERFIFVTGRNKSSIEDHFDNAFELEKALDDRNKMELLEKTMGWMPQAGQIVFLRQQKPLGLGHAVLCAERFVGDEAFAVCLADDMDYGENENFLGKMIQVAGRENASVLGVTEVPEEDVTRYGIVSVRGAAGDVLEVDGMVEKPPLGEAPSRFAAVGKYILGPSIFKYLKKVRPGVNSEIQLTDGIKMAMADGEPHRALIFRDNRFDCGSLLGYLEANVHYALENKAIESGVRGIIEKFHRKIHRKINHEN